MRATGLNQNPQVTKAFIDAGADVNARDKILGFTPLVLAAGWNQNPEVIKLLLGAGLMLMREIKDGLTPLM